MKVSFLNRAGFVVVVALTFTILFTACATKNVKPTNVSQDEAYQHAIEDLKKIYESSPKGELYLGAKAGNGYMKWDEEGITIFISRDFVGKFGQAGTEYFEKAISEMNQEVYSTSPKGKVYFWESSATYTEWNDNGITLFVPKSEIIVGLIRPAIPNPEAGSYRYSLTTRWGDPLYVRAIDARVDRGRRYDVETDQTGRVIRVNSFVDGKKIAGNVYRFDYGGRLPSGYNYYAANGELTARVELQRNQNGERTRIEYYTVERKLAEYTTRVLDGSRAVNTGYSADGKKKDVTIDYFNKKGIAIRSGWYPGQTRDIWYESEIDESTGLSTVRKKYAEGRLESTNTYEYDENNMRKTDRIYDDRGTQFGTRNYVGGLKISEKYTFRSGDTEESQYKHDDRRWVSEVNFYRNGQLICRFIYDRLPNGTIIRTRALSPGGELMAEYPDLFVDKVKRNGRPLDGPTYGTILKQGNWW